MNHPICSPCLRRLLHQFTAIVAVLALYSSLAACGKITFSKLLTDIDIAAEAALPILEVGGIVPAPLAPVANWVLDSLTIVSQCANSAQVGLAKADACLASSESLIKSQPFTTNQALQARITAIIQAAQGIISSIQATQTVGAGQQGQAMKAVKIDSTAIQNAANRAAEIADKYRQAGAKQ
jgi:hypothetical protein